MGWRIIIKQTKIGCNEIFCSNPDLRKRAKPPGPDGLLFGIFLFSEFHGRPYHSYEVGSALWKLRKWPFLQNSTDCRIRVLSTSSMKELVRVRRAAFSELHKWPWNSCGRLFQSLKDGLIFMMIQWLILLDWYIGCNWHRVNHGKYDFWLVVKIKSKIFLP